MSEIEEGDQVVTPSILGGKIGEVVDTTEWDEKKHCSVDDGDKRNDNIPADELVKVDQPIRVRVSRECYAESLVALARECGFECQQSEDEIIRRSVHNTAGHDDHIQLYPDEKRISVDDWYDHDLTYAQNLPQIEAWLEANSESGNECVCDENNQVTIAKGKEVPCPNCTDASDNTMSVNDDDERWIQNESEEYDEPRPEDEEWRRLSVEYQVEESITGDDLGYDDLEHFTIPIRELLYYINDLEFELQDVREERDELRKLINSAMDDDIDTVFDDRDNLRERIEEADDKLAEVSIDMTDMEIGGKIVEVRKILTPDSDEGDGE